jgi:hypothetical protein
MGIPHSHRRRGEASLVSLKIGLWCMPPDGGAGGRLNLVHGARQIAGASPRDCRPAPSRFGAWLAVPVVVHDRMVRPLARADLLFAGTAAATLLLTVFTMPLTPCTVAAPCRPEPVTAFVVGLLAAVAAMSFVHRWSDVGAAAACAVVWPISDRFDDADLGWRGVSSADTGSCHGDSGAAAGARDRRGATGSAATTTRTASAAVFRPAPWRPAYCCWSAGSPPPGGRCGGGTGSPSRRRPHAQRPRRRRSHRCGTT